MYRFIKFVNDELSLIQMALQYRIVFVVIFLARFRINNQQIMLRLMKLSLKYVKSIDQTIKHLEEHAFDTSNGVPEFHTDTIPDS